MFSTKPDACIFLNQNELLIGRHTRLTEPLACNKSDLILLAVYSQAAMAPDEGIAEIQRSGKSLLGAHLNSDELINRIDELRAADILYTEALADTRSASPRTGDALPIAGDSYLNRKLTYRLAKNFQLTVDNGSFLAWSPSERIHYSLSIEDALLLFCFGSGKRGNKAITECKSLGKADTLSQRIISLLQSRILLEEKKDASLEKASKYTAPRKRKTASRHTEKASTDSADRLSGRVPVYFIPHMINHYPLALGMMHSYIQLERWRADEQVYADSHHPHESETVY